MRDEGDSNPSSRARPIASVRSCIPSFVYLLRRCRDRIQRLASISGDEASSAKGVNVFAYEGMIAMFLFHLRSVARESLSAGLG